MEKIKIKIIGISCGHRKGRNTAWLTMYALKAAEKFGRRIEELAEIETEFVDLWGKQISSHASCQLRNGDFELTGDDYITRELMPKMAEADGFIFGSPVFTGSYTSTLISLFEHLRGWAKSGCFTDKPAGTVAVATVGMGGQELCLDHMNICIRSVGMIPVNWLNGAAGTSGMPYGPLPGRDNGKVIAVQKDRFGQWEALFTGRRVAEIAVMQKLAKRRLGRIYDDEFIKVCRLPMNDGTREWAKLDEADENYMAMLDSEELKRLDGKILNSPKQDGNSPVVCKVVGLSCDDYRGRDTSWLVIHSLKAIEEFGRRIRSIGDFETEFIDLSEKEMKHCLNCDKRYEIPNGGEGWKGAEYPNNFGCIIKDDYIAQVVHPKIAGGDGFIIGASVCALTPSVTFRIFAERLVDPVWRGQTTRKPTANIAVAYGDDDGQETCLNIMNTCNRWVELIPVGWPHGVPARGSSSISRDGITAIAVKDDSRACALSILNARRVAQFALMTKLAQQELGDVYHREFYSVIHPPHGEDRWEWNRLDPEDEDYMHRLTPDMVADLGK